MKFFTLLVFLIVTLHANKESAMQLQQILQNYPQLNTILNEKKIKLNGEENQKVHIINPKDLQGDKNFIVSENDIIIINGDLNIENTFYTKGKIANIDWSIKRKERIKIDESFVYDDSPKLKNIVFSNKNINKKPQQVKKPIDKSKLSYKEKLLYDLEQLKQKNLEFKQELNEFNKDFNKNTILIVLGDLEAKNAIFARNLDLLFVVGDMKIKNIALKGSDKNFYIKGNITTKFLLHSTEKSFDLKTKFNYQKQISHKSPDIVDKSILIPEEDLYGKYMSQYYLYNNLFESLNQNKKIINEKIEEIDIKKLSSDKFIYKMTQYDTHLGLAGFDEVYLNLKYESDIPLFDARKGEGYWAIEHETQDGFYKVKTNKKPKLPQNFQASAGVDILSTEELYKRYFWIAEMFDNFFGYYVDIEKHFGSNAEIEKLWDKEKKYIENDIYLAFYWYLHFALVFDERYQEVQKVIENMDKNERDKLELVQNGFDFFADNPHYKKVVIEYRYKDDSAEDKQKVVDIFEKRRAYLVSEYYKNSADFDKWKLPFIIYPQTDKKHFEKIWTFSQNITKHNKQKEWQEFLIKHKNIPLANYISTLSNKEQNISEVLDEILKIWKKFTPKSYEKDYAKELLFALKDIENLPKNLYKKVVDEIFDKDLNNSKYVEILKTIGEFDNTKQQVKQIATAIDNQFIELGKHNANKPKLKQEYINYIKNISPELVLPVIKSINKSLLNDFFVVIFNKKSQKYKDKQEILTYIFFEAFSFEWDIRNAFGEQYPYVITDKNDENIAILGSIFDKIIYSKYKTDNKRYYLKSITQLYVTSLHFESVFNHIFQHLQNAYKNNEGYVIDVLHTQLFSTHYETEINPTQKLNKTQVESYLKFLFNDLSLVEMVGGLDNKYAKEILLDKLYSKELLAYDLKNDEGLGVNYYIENALEKASTNSQSFCMDIDKPVFTWGSNNGDNITNWQLYIFDTIVFDIIAKGDYDFISMEKKEFKNFQEALKYAKERQKEIKDE